MEYIKVSESKNYNLYKHPSIHCSGSVRGMKKLGFWGENDEIVKCGNYYYNLSIDLYR